MEIKQILKSKRKTYIMLEELENILQSQNYQDLYQDIKDLVSDGIIKPIKNKNRTNGKFPSLFLKYKILVQDDENEQLRDEIKHLTPDFEISKYLNNVELYKKHRKNVLILDKFFKENATKLKFQMSKNERAYQIWRYEKMLDTSIVKSIIAYNGLEKKLNFYMTPEPFFDYIPEIQDTQVLEKMVILIVENKDAWYTLRKIFKQKKELKIEGKLINGLLYGEGNKITKPEAIVDYESKFIGRTSSFLYWGDLDFTGIDMFERVKKQNLNSDIKLFSEIYEKMIDLSNIEDLSEIHNKQNTKIKLEDFLSNFNENYKEKIKEILEQNKYIPQEILNYVVLGGA